MFKKLKEIVKNATVKEPVDVSRFNDPLALKTGWTPVKPGGTNFRTHRLVETDSLRMEFRPTIGVILFSGIFILLGIAVPYFVITAMLEDPAGVDKWAPLYIGLFGLVFAGAGGGLYYYKARPRVFSKANGFYWLGYKEPERSFTRDSEPLKNSAPLREIHAIQLLSEYVRGNKSSYYSYELNLVLRSGERLNVVDHGNRARLLEDAQKLSRFIDRPLWDAT